MRHDVGVLVVWWLALATAFMVLTGEWTAVDVAGAVAAGLVASGLVAVLRVRRLPGFVLRVGWLSAVPAVLWQVFVDFGIITLALIRCVARGRREQGAFVARDFPAGGATAEGSGWRAFVTLAATLSPNSYVVDIDREGQRRLNHDLVPNRASERPA